MSEIISINVYVVMNEIISIVVHVVMYKIIKIVVDVVMSKIISIVVDVIMSKIIGICAIQSEACVIVCKRIDARVCIVEKLVARISNAVVMCNFINLRNVSILLEMAIISVAIILDCNWEQGIEAKRHTQSNVSVSFSIVVIADNRTCKAITVINIKFFQVKTRCLPRIDLRTENLSGASCPVRQLKVE